MCVCWKRVETGKPQNKCESGLSATGRSRLSQGRCTPGEAQFGEAEVMSRSHKGCQQHLFGSRPEWVCGLHNSLAGRCSQAEAHCFLAAYNHLWFLCLLSSFHVLGEEAVQKEAGQDSSTVQCSVSSSRTNSQGISDCHAVQAWGQRLACRWAGQQPEVWVGGGVSWHLTLLAILSVGTVVFPLLNTEITKVSAMSITKGLCLAKCFPICLYADPLCRSQVDQAGSDSD